MARFYWAVRPKSHQEHIRIEKAETPREACRLAFGRGCLPGRWEAKNLGTRITIMHSDKKRIALLQDPKGWEVLN